MVFFINLIISILYSERIGELYKNKNVSIGGYILLYSPVLIIWLLISSTQYYVGTDYGSYMEIFNGQNIDRYEIGFLIILKGFFSIGIKGQIFYLIFYTISFITLFYIFREFDNNIRYVVFLIIIYICVSNLFNNQLNGLRQAVATYIGSLGFIFFLKKKKLLFWILYFVAISIHFASIIYIIVFLTHYLSKLKKNILYLFILTGSIMSVFLTIDLFYCITDFLPKNYANHIIYNFIENRSIGSMALKYILIPLYLLAISKLDNYGLGSIQKNIFYWGIIGFSIKLALLGLPIISRICDYFVLISIYPIYVLLTLFVKTKKYIILSCIIIFLISLYFFKTVIFPSAEYSYQTIINNIF